MKGKPNDTTIDSTMNLEGQGLGDESKSLLFIF
jgi:hypothetical protein